MTEPSPYKGAAYLARWPRRIEHLEDELRELNLKIALIDSLDQRPALVARRRVLVAEIERAKAEIMRAEDPAL
jgi:hypothetical protein